MFCINNNENVPVGVAQYELLLTAQFPSLIKEEQAENSHSMWIPSCSADKPPDSPHLAC